MFSKNEMASFEPMEIISFCIIIAAIIVVSPHWLMLWQKHKKEKALKNLSQLPQINKPNIPPPPSRLNQEYQPVMPSPCTTPLPGQMFPTKFAN